MRTETERWFAAKVELGTGGAVPDAPRAAEVRRGRQERLRLFDSRVLIGLLAFKLCFFFFCAVSIELLPIFQVEVFQRLTHWPLEGEQNWQSNYATWDGAHYLRIAQHGYVQGSLSCAFYPLWPFLIRTFAMVCGGSTFWSGIILVNVISIAALLLLHRLIAESEGVRIADLALILFLAFPGALFMSLIYTEPLFLFLSVLFFLLLFRRKYLWASLVAFFLPLTKAVGIFAMAPLVWQLWSERRPWRYYLPLAGPVLGYGCYFLTMWLWTDNPLEGFDAQKQFPTQPSISKLFDLPGFLNALVSVDSLHSATGSLIDRIFFILLLALLPGVFRRNTALGVYTLLIGVVPAASASFISYSRNVMMCFPIFMVLAKLLRAEARGIVFWYVVAIVGAVQICFLIRYLNFYWAG